MTTFAGLAANSGSADGKGTTARFASPVGLCMDLAGNLYVCDIRNFNLRKISPDGTVITLAGALGVQGSLDGSGTNALFNNPRGLAVDSGGALYVADTGNNSIRKITPNGTVTTLAGLAGISGSADGSGTNAWFNDPRAVAVDSNGTIYVADNINDTIRKISPAGQVTTFAGLARTAGGADGLGNLTRFQHPQGVAVDGAGTLFVVDTDNDSIRRGEQLVKLSSPRSFSSQRFQFQISGYATSRQVLQSSTDLIVWQSLSTNILPAGGILGIADPSATFLPPARFYRTVLLP